MGATAAAVGSWLAGSGAATAAATVAGGVVAGAAIASASSKAPTINVPGAPQTDPLADGKKAEGAGEQARKRAAAASAAGSTILTGPGGLGEVSADQQGRKNLLGY